MNRKLKLYSLVLVAALMVGAGAPRSLAQDEASQDEEKSQKEEKPKKKGGFFSGLKAISGSSTEQQEVTATAGSKTVGEGEEIGNAKPSAVDRQAVTGMENYSIPQDELAKFQEEGQLKSNE